MSALSEYPLVKSPQKLDAAKTLLEAARFGYGLDGPMQARDDNNMAITDEFRYLQSNNEPLSCNQSTKHDVHHGFKPSNGNWDAIFTSPTHFHSSALDALAALASTERQLNVMSSSDEDSESMPPPPPRRRGRMRSVSNPEGMEKWDSYSSARQHFVLPRSLLEQELASVKLACREKEIGNDVPSLMSSDNSEYEIHSSDKNHLHDGASSRTLDLEQILKEARSRLSEEMAESLSNSDKGDALLPHLLEKYKEIYNKNGRIGIYTPDERAAIIAKFHRKRARRVWNKKIRYNCRKNLADQRQRVKGRFVKRSPEIEVNRQEDSMKSTPSLMHTSLATVQEDSPDSEDETTLPNVMDQEAEFIPTRGQPYRRVRRYTIT